MDHSKPIFQIGMQITVHVLSIRLGHQAEHPLHNIRELMLYWSALYQFLVVLFIKMINKICHLQWSSEARCTSTLPWDVITLCSICTVTPATALVAVSSRRARLLALRSCISWNKQCKNKLQYPYRDSKMQQVSHPMMWRLFQVKYTDTQIIIS